MDNDLTETERQFIRLLSEAKEHQEVIKLIDGLLYTADSSEPPAAHRETAF